LGGIYSLKGRYYGVPLGEDDKIDDNIPKNEGEQKLKDGRPLTREEISKLTSEQSADFTPLLVFN
jgi:hypothetical protein